MNTITSYVLLGILWLSYVFLHSSLAATKVKISIKTALNIEQPLYRVGYNIFALAGLVFIIWYQLKLKTIVLIQNSVLLSVIAIILSTAGFIIMLICILKYFKNLSGLQDKPNQLMVTGLHRYVRHPLYLGTFILLLGVFAWFPFMDVLIMDFIIIMYTLIALRWEEAKLVKEFGEGYKKYQQEVPAIVPGF